jgi:hypothetical protein
MAECKRDFGGAEATFGTAWGKDGAGGSGTIPAGGDKEAYQQMWPRSQKRLRETSEQG